MGSTVTLSGSSFTGASSVAINGTLCSSFTVVSDAQLTAVVPQSAPVAPSRSPRPELQRATRTCSARSRVAENLAALRRVTLRLLTQEATASCGLKGKRLKAGWSEDYLLKALQAA